jgi:hypothetical protein
MYVVEGASVTLTRAGRQIGAARTNMFGDFKNDDLTADGAVIEFRVSAPAGQLRTKAPLTGSLCLPKLKSA